MLELQFLLYEAIYAHRSGGILTWPTIWITLTTVTVSIICWDMRDPSNPFPRQHAPRINGKHFRHLSMLIFIWFVFVVTSTPSEDDEKFLLEFYRPKRSTRMHGVQCWRPRQMTERFLLEFYRPKISTRMNGVQFFDTGMKLSMQRCTWDEVSCIKHI